MAQMAVLPRKLMMTGIIACFYAQKNEKSLRETAVFDWYGGQSQFLEAHKADPDELNLGEWLEDDPD